MARAQTGKRGFQRAGGDRAAERVRSGRDAIRIEWRGHGKNDRNERPEKERALRYRRLSYRYTMVTGSALPERLLEDLWQLERVRLLMETRWRPDADMYETASAFEIVVDLAGIGRASCRERV